MQATRSPVKINKVGSGLVFGTDYSEVDHQYGETRSICFHKPKTELKEGYVVSIEYKREKEIANLPMMFVELLKSRLSAEKLTMIYYWTCDLSCS